MVKVILPNSAPASQGSPKRLENSATELRTSRKKLRRWPNLSNYHRIPLSPVLLYDVEWNEW